MDTEETIGSLTLRRTRPAPVLDAHRDEILAVLGRPLPDEFAAFYAQSDGMTFSAARDGEDLGLEQTLCGLAEMFAGFVPHPQLHTAEAFDAALEEGALYDAPHCGRVWSEDLELRDDDEDDGGPDADVAGRIDRLLRSKLLVSIAGQSEALVVDFAPPSGADYELLNVYEGHDPVRLDLSFATFVEQFARFGTAGWPWAYAAPEAVRGLNLALADTVEAALAPFADAFPDEVAALVARTRALDAAVEALAAEHDDDDEHDDDEYVEDEDEDDDD